MAEKFLFTNSFDDPDPEDTLVLSEVKLLKQQAYEEGRLKGLEEAAISNETKAVELLPHLQANLDQSVEIERGKLQEVTKQAAEISAAIVEKTFPVLSERGAVDELTEFIKLGLQQCPEDIACQITVSAQLQEDIQKYISRLVPPVKITVEGDPNLFITDCRIQWGSGGVERLTTSIIAQVTEGLSRLCEKNVKFNLAPSATEKDGGAEEQVTDELQEAIIDTNVQGSQSDLPIEEATKEIQENE